MNWSEREFITGRDGAESVQDGSEIDKNPIESLLERLGFSVGPELSEATEVVLVGLSDESIPDATIRLAWSEYTKIANQVVESAKTNPTDPRAYKKANVAAIVHKALILQTAGKINDYLGELDKAESVASKIILSSESAVIQKEMDTIVGTFEASPEVLTIKLKGVIR